MFTTKNRGHSASSAWPIVAALLFSCGGEAEPDGPPGSGTAGAGAGAEILEHGDTVSLTSDSARGRFQIRIRPDGGAIPLNQPFAVTVDLLDPATGERLQGFDDVTLDARMPAHGHGMLRDVDLVPTDTGALRAEGLLFHMIGHWEFHVDVTRGPRVERAQASYELVL